jgi:hypothetical protein
MGLISGDPKYYSSGQAANEAGAYGHAIDVAFRASAPGSPERTYLVQQLVSQGIIKGDPSYWINGDAGALGADMTNLVNAAETGFTQSKGGTTGTAGTVDQGGGVTTSAAAGAATAGAEGAVKVGVGGKSPDTISILTSPSQQFFFDPATGLWYISYKLPNSDRRVVFEATGAQMDSIFGDGQRPTSYQETSFANLTKTQTFSGDIVEMSGTGSFESEVARVTQLALDEGQLPQWAQDDKAVMDIIYIAHTEKKSDEWVIEQISKLDSFKARYPGIEVYKNLGLTTEDAVTGWLEMDQTIKQNMLRLGIDPKTLSPATVGDIIKQGHSATDVKFVYDSFQKFQDNAGALAAFNEVLVEHGMQPLSAEDQLAFLEGNAPVELYTLWEEASFNQAAQDAGLDIGVQDAISLASATEGFTSYSDAYAGLNKAASSLLAFRTELDSSRYGLDQEDLIDIALGIAPRSGRSAAEIGQGMERALSAARAGVDGPRANRFRQYSKEGTPQAVSTSRARAQE